VYKNLDPGEYTFIVNAAINNAIWNEHPITVKFEIQTPIYSKPIFFIFLFTCLVFIGSAYIFFRYKKKEKKQRDKYKTSTLDPDVAKETILKLIQLIETDKLYLDPDLTLKDLSQMLKIHYNHLSRIINEQFGLSYNDYINKYRIEEAKSRLSSKKYKEQTISQIMYDTGFYSKSVFNSAFKKFTGFTPSEFRKKNLAY
jgi:AraC-like DNA-binding protein